jgi:hypothetical protein
MSDLEEVISRKYLLIDTWDVRHQHLLISSFSILLFAIYGAFLWLLSSMTPSIFTSLLLLSSQIGLGLPATRAFYDFGVTSRGMLKLYDSGILGTDVETRDLKINVGDLPLVFERLDFEIRKFDSGSLDDLNDLAWFVVIAWAMISSIGIFIEFVGVAFFFLGAVVLVITCFACYVSGYRTIQGFSFEEDLHHLEYYVDRCIKAADTALPSANGHIILQVTKRGRQTILIDIIVEFTTSLNSIIEYHIGLSSHLQERFIIDAPTETLDMAYAKFKELSVVKELRWTLEQVTTQTGRIVKLSNSERMFSMCNRSSFVINPDIAKKNALVVNETLSGIAKILGTL